MKAKRERRERAKRLTEDGLPRDARDWTEDDWRALHEGLERIKARVRNNHANDAEKDKVP
jgi:hypothetical protein